jgi:hypothetical protein
MSTADSASSEYVLGSSARELARLGLQARILNGFSEAFLRNAGIEPGMHCLMLAAELVISRSWRRTSWAQLVG